MEKLILHKKTYRGARADYKMTLANNLSKVTLIPQNTIMRVLYQLNPNVLYVNDINFVVLEYHGDVMRVLDAFGEDDRYGLK